MFIYLNPYPFIGHIVGLGKRGLYKGWDLIIIGI